MNEWSSDFSNFVSQLCLGGAVAWITILLGTFLTVFIQRTDVWIFGAQRADKLMED